MSKLDNQDLAPYLKKDAIVSIKIGTGFLEQMGSIIPLLLDGKSQEDVAKIETLMKEGKPLEPWMQAIATIQVLIRTVFEEAEKEGMVEFRSLEEMIKDEMSTMDSSPEDQSAQ